MRKGRKAHLDPKSGHIFIVYSSESQNQIRDSDCGVPTKSPPLLSLILSHRILSLAPVGYHEIAAFRSSSLPVGAEGSIIHSVPMKLRLLKFRMWDQSFFSIPPSPFSSGDINIKSPLLSYQYMSATFLLSHWYLPLPVTLVSLSITLKWKRKGHHGW